MSDKPTPTPILAKGAEIARADGWANVLTGLGMASKDKRVGAEAVYEPMREVDCENLYASDDVAAALIDTLPDDAIREWVCFTGFDDDQGKALEDELDVLKAPTRINLGWKFGRCYGGAAILMNVDDSMDLSEPLNLDRIRELKSLVVLTRYELWPKTYDTDLFSDNYGRPLTYVIRPRQTPMAVDTQDYGSEVHHTRLIRFDGVKLPQRLEIANQYWGDSLFTRTFNAIRNYNVSHDAIATILQEFNQGVFKMKGLADLLLNGDDEVVLNRLQIINISRSVARSVVLDSDGESFDNVAAAVTGIPDMLTKVGQRLVVASRMPHTKILGESPSGLGASGDSEERNWYDYVSNQQELELRPKIRRLCEVILRSRKGPTKGIVPDGWGFDFKPLWQPTEKEQAETRYSQAQTDEIYIRNNVLDPEEVALSRFGSGSYSHETTIDVGARAAGDDSQDNEPDTTDPKELPPSPKKVAT